MLDFLRSLAPQNLDGKSSAVAALPSRFEIDQPLRSVPTPTMPETADEEITPHAAAEAVALPALLTPPDEIEHHSNGERRAARALIDRPLEHTAALLEAHVPHEISRVPVVARSSTTSRSSEVPPSPSERSTMPREIRSAPAVSEPPIQLPVREATAAPARMPAPNAVRPSAAPLSPEAVAARVSTRAENRPVVHVTIDRVDVRVPASAERPKPPRRSSSSSASLSDYLRARHSDRRGGRP